MAQHLAVLVNFLQDTLFMAALLYGVCWYRYCPASDLRSLSRWEKLDGIRFPQSKVCKQGVWKTIIFQLNYDGAKVNALLLEIYFFSEIEAKYM